MYNHRCSNNLEPTLLSAKVGSARALVECGRGGLDPETDKRRAQAEQISQYWFRTRIYQ